MMEPRRLHCPFTFLLTGAVYDLSTLFTGVATGLRTTATNPALDEPPPPLSNVAARVTVPSLILSSCNLTVR